MMALKAFDQLEDHLPCNFWVFLEVISLAFECEVGLPSSLGFPFSSLEVHLSVSEFVLILF